MSEARLLNTEADYKKLGINPEKIEVWEDKKREPTDKGSWEWWYFDAILDDGTAVVIQFLEKSFANIHEKNPKKGITFKITLPDGTEYSERPHFSPNNCSYGEDKCDVHYGENYFVGDLQEYHIHMEPTGKIAADLTLTSLTTPFRPGTSYFEFEKDKYYTWLCAVPKGKVEGTLTIDGKEITVSGYGYHDHQWGKSAYINLWNHWTWARQSFDDYTLLVFDMTTSKEYGAERFPIAFLEDKDGNVIFHNEKGVEYHVSETQIDPASGKTYPKKSTYTFENDGKKIIYELESLKTLEGFGNKNMHLTQKLAMKALHLKAPSYSRYLGHGNMTFLDGQETIERSGELIYEFMNPGVEYTDL